MLNNMVFSLQALLCKVKTKKTINNELSPDSMKRGFINLQNIHNRNQWQCLLTGLPRLKNWSN